MASMMKEEFKEKTPVLKSKTKEKLDDCLERGVLPDIDQLIDEVRLECRYPIDDGLVFLLSIS